MILHTKLAQDAQGNIKSNPSAYRPGKDIETLTQQVLSDFERSYELMHRPYRELNDMSVLERQDVDQKTFNSYVPPGSSDPDEAWKSNAQRPIARNRAISIAAHVTGSLMYPVVQAQNDQQEEDKAAAEVMRDLMEYANENSNGAAGYEKTLVNAVIAAIVNPAVIIHTQFAETYRTVKEIQEDGSFKKAEILDEAFSGFQDHLVPIDELFIADIYQADIQKQPYLVWRRVIDITDSEARYGSHANFKYVTPGVQTIFDSATGDFYEQQDETMSDRQVEEVTYYNRSKDLQICFINGILVTDKDQPNPRKDKKYPFAKTGYELIDEGRFFYYKSLIFKMGPDVDIVNTLYRMVIDGTFLKLMPPGVVFGEEEIRSSMVTPGTITHLDKESKYSPIDVGSDLGAGVAMLQKAEDSLSESSSDVMQSGQSNKGNQTAFEISRLEENARIMLGLFGKMIGFLVKDFGYLRVSDILQFLTVGDIDQIADSDAALKFKSFVLPDKTVEGKSKTREIKFDPYLPSEPMSEDSLLDQSFAIMDEEGGLDSDRQIYKVNPRLFRKLKFLLKITPDVVTPPSENVKKALKLEQYDRAIRSPLANQEAIFRDLLLGAYDATKNDTDKYIQKPVQPMPQPGAPAGGLATALASPGKPGGPNELLSKVA